MGISPSITNLRPNTSQNAPQSLQQQVQQTTDAGAPDWAASGPIRTLMGYDPSGAYAEGSAGTIAYVQPGAEKIDVAQPGLYTQPVAAHEATHVFQNSRNGDFLRTIQSLAPGPPLLKDYEYGGVAGLQTHPLKSIGDYNPEQQARMVEDLTTAQDQLKPMMTPEQLQQWDTTKAALERPIRQLLAVPPPDTSLAGKADEWIAERPLGELLDHPFTRLKGILSPPPMPKGPDAPPEPPSVAMGFAVPSRLVK